MAAVPNGSRWPAAGVARGEADAWRVFPPLLVPRGGAAEAGTRAGEVAFSRPAPAVSPPAAVTVPGAAGSPPAPVAARAASVPPVMTEQAPSTARMTRTCWRRGLPRVPPGAECLPLLPENDVLTT